MSDVSGERIGGFRVLEALHGGSGSQGTVYRAVCETPPFPTVRAGEIVALKTMVAPDEDGVSFERLKKRTDALTAIDSPHVVRYRGCFPVVDAFNSIHVVVMDCLEGETLKERLAANPDGLDVDSAIAIADGALAGLAAAAAAGIIHRDVKPGNIFICRDGTVKLIDFEIAHRVDATASSASGRFLGTFDYMAPEFGDPSFRGDECSDVFSLGVVLHESLSGRTPYAKGAKKGEAADFAFLSRWTRTKTGESPIHVSSRATCLLSRAKEVLEKALSPDRAVRYQDFMSFRAAIRAVRFRELRNGSNAYRLLRLIGKGGFGEVYKARNRATDQLVAVKRLLKIEYCDRFRREERIMRRFRDACFTQFLDYFETEQAGVRSAFLVMEYLPDMPGSSLRDAIRRRAGAPLPEREALKAFARYAHGLAVLHRENVFHRDIKPSNLYYPEGCPERAVIMDMGIARDASGTRTTGNVPGTLDYMPPEIVMENSRGDAGMDIYALGLCLYEAVSGKMGYPRLPTGSTGFAAFYARARGKNPPVFDDPIVRRRPELLDLLRRMTNPERAKRLGDAGEVERILLNLSAGKDPAPVPPPRPVPSPPLADPPTRETTETPNNAGARPPRVSRESMHKLVGWTLKGAAALVLLLGCWWAWPLVEKGRDGIKNMIHARKLDAERRRAEQAVRDRDYRENMRLQEQEATERLKREKELAAQLAEKRRKAAEEEKRKAEEKRRADEKRKEDEARIAAERERRREAELAAAEKEQEKTRREEAEKKRRRDEAEERLRREKLARDERCVENECEALFENIGRVDSETVRHWRADTLDRAGFEIKRALSEGRLTEEGCRGLNAEIARRRGWTVGVVDNKTQHTLKIDALGVTIRPMESVTVVFTNAVPENAVVSAPGFDPVRLDAERLDSKVFLVQRLVPSGGGLKRIVPETFERTPSVPAVAEPAGTPGETSEVRLARETRELKTRGDRIQAECETNLVVQPIETRRARLEKVHAILNHWQTPSALGQVRLDALRAKYNAERRRVVGRIQNDMPTEARIDVYGTQQTVAPGTSRLIFLDKGLPAEGTAVSVHGYKSVRVASSADFDGKTLILDVDHLAPLPVRVAPPKLEAGVTCRIEGRDVVSGIDLPPGEYKCIYARSGFSEQTFVQRVEAGVPMTLPPPKPWEKAGAMDGIFSTFRNLTDSTTRGVKSAVEEVGTIRRKSDEDR